VPYRDHAARVYSAPLLPFERDLIATIGCSEEEYRWYKQQVALRTKERPAEYDLVPDVQNTGAEIIAIVSLVIGLASTAVSLLLAPKPPSQPESPREGRNKRLAAQTVAAASIKLLALKVALILRNSVCRFRSSLVVGRNAQRTPQAESWWHQRWCGRGCSAMATAKVTKGCMSLAKALSVRLT
jgi:hypothetical protein